MVKMGDMETQWVQFVRNQGYFMNCFMKNAYHITNLYSQLYMMLQKIQHIRSYLDQDTSKIVVQALIMSKLEYCNSLLIRSAEYQLDKLQRIQNMVCRVVLNLKKFNHVSAYMKNLHWLRIRERIKYRITTLIFKCKDGKAPGYLIDLLPNRKHYQALRSSTADHLEPAFHKNALTSKLSFSFAAPRTWNSLHNKPEGKMHWIPSRRVLRHISSLYLTISNITLFSNTIFQMQCTLGLV